MYRITYQLCPAVIYLFASTVLLTSRVATSVSATDHDPHVLIVRMTGTVSEDRNLRQRLAHPGNSQPEILSCIPITLTTQQYVLPPRCRSWLHSLPFPLWQNTRGHVHASSTRAFQRFSFAAPKLLQPPNRALGPLTFSDSYPKVIEPETRCILLLTLPGDNGSIIRYVHFDQLAG